MQGRALPPSATAAGGAAPTLGGPRTSYDVVINDSSSLIGVLGAAKPSARPPRLGGWLWAATKPKRPHDGVPQLRRLQERRALQEREG